MAVARSTRSAARVAPASGDDLGSVPDDVEIVVPCYNEASRLRVADFVAFVRAPETRARLLFVDDGSSDGTLAALHEARDACPDRIDILSLPSNVGKAEAVRLGMRRACGDAIAERPKRLKPSFVGFWDADLATPLNHVGLFRDVFIKRPETDMVFGARVGLLGRDIQRSARRHYVGRAFATLASFALGMPVYDTQCGAKLFRVGDDLEAALSEPFDTRWVFDCELVGRYASLRRARSARAAGGSAAGPRTKAKAILGNGVSKNPRDERRVVDSIYEYPLHEWKDVAGSKVKPSDAVKMAWGLARLRMKYFSNTPWTPSKRKREP
jgi:glycosyltransferase involved in cell wall biosynthesis